MKRIGILGGTFDPPHLGHLIIAEEVRLAMQLEEVWLMPSYEPPHKEKASSDGMDRVAMLKRAIDGNPSFLLTAIEMQRLGKSYTFDTMKIITSEYPDADFYFIIGADMVEYLPHWQNIDQLMDLVKFVGVKRNGHQLETEYPLETVDVPLIDISSTMIRNRIADKNSIKYLVPEAVEVYIKENHLYEN
ncbi:nicotinate-nucleotide adenylyltransferase [Virgibacillus siamensis]|uniref:nicotinate-nucleotide adenylyltransferase n=1 Tax=Virgibacillus siamensis TaxID=480071 RepID=UPI0009850EEE|nr:nicotinate-nucleotide adenylyltransferase [Virgibacillus siamensis]